MVTADDVKIYIERGLPCEHIELAGDGQHFQALIVSAEFRGKNRVQRHQRVYQAHAVHELVYEREWREQVRRSGVNKSGGVA